MKEKEKPFAVSPFISDSVWSCIHTKDWKVIGNSFRARSNSINTTLSTHTPHTSEQKEGRKRSFSLNSISIYKNITPQNILYPSSPAKISASVDDQFIPTEKGSLSHLRRHSLDPSIFNSVARAAALNGLDRSNSMNSMNKSYSMNSIDGLSSDREYFSNSIVCIVQFGGGNRCFGLYKGLFLVKGVFVIIEGDRGENCGSVIIEQIDPSHMNELSVKYSIHSTEIKKIYRIANDKDKLLLLEQNELEQAAVTSCREKVKEKKLPMEIVNAEYQWDRNKLTFYFKSPKRIDFRELVKELYKTYKTRIWMCAVEKKGVRNIVYKHE